GIGPAWCRRELRRQPQDAGAAALTPDHEGAASAIGTERGREEKTGVVAASGETAERDLDERAIRGIVADESGVVEPLMVGEGDERAARAVGSRDREHQLLDCGVLARCGPASEWRSRS